MSTLQELLAAQLIQAFAHIFSESCLPLYLRPYEVLVTSSRTALIEVVPDSLSIHTIKVQVLCQPQLDLLWGVYWPSPVRDHRMLPAAVAPCCSWSACCAAGRSDFGPI